MSLKCTMGPIPLWNGIYYYFILLIDNYMKRRMPFLICSRQKSFFENSISFNGRNAKIQIRPSPVFWSDHWPLKVVRSTVNIIVAFKRAFNLRYINTYLPKYLPISLKIVTYLFNILLIFVAGNCFWFNYPIYFIFCFITFYCKTLTIISEGLMPS